MASNQQLEELIGAADSAVESGLTYFEGPGAESEVRVETWSPREVLCHMVYWHQATAEGIESVASGGPPYRIYASTDEMNARAVGRCSGKNVSQLSGEVRGFHERLVNGARSMSDPDATVLIRGDGAETSAVQRLQRILEHWNGHVKQLQELGTQASAST